MKKFFSWIILFYSIFLFAQNYTVKGKISDFHNKISIPNAEVLLGKNTTRTNDKGEFVFNQIPKGTYVLKVSKSDFDEFTESVSVDKDLFLSINLELHSKEIETVSLHANHKSSGSMVVKTLEKAEIEKNSTSNLGNLLSSISGVSALKTGNNIAKPIIHGLYGSRIAIINNGVKLAEQEWGVEHAPNVDVSNFEHIDVIKGASALKYSGDAVGGVVDLKPEILPKKDTIKGNANIYGISNGKGLGLDLNIVKSWKNGWAIKTGGKIEKLGDQNTPDYNLMNTGMDFSSFNFTLQKNEFKKGISFDYFLTNQNIGIYRGSHIGNLEDFYNAINSQMPIYTGDFSYQIDNPRQEIEHHIMKISTYKRYEKLGKISATYSFQFNHRKEYDIRRGDLKVLPSLDLELLTHQLNVENLIERAHWSLETGIAGSFQNNYSDPATKARRLIPNYDKYSGGIFSVFKYKLNHHWNVEAGARFDYNYYDVTKWYDKSDWEKLYANLYPQFYVRTNANRVLTRPKLDYQNLSLNAGVEYISNSRDFIVKMNYAKASRTPNIAELFSDGLHHSAAIIEVGNLSMKNEVSHQFNLVIDSKIHFLEGLQLSFNPYASFNKNFINQIPTGVQNTIRGVFPVWTYQQIDALMYGADLDIMLHFSPEFSYKGRASYVYGQDNTNDEPLILMMPSNFSNALHFTKEKWNGFYFNLENQIFSYQKRFPIHNAEITLYENGQDVTKTVDLSTPPKAYSLWNVQTGFNITKNLSTGLIVNNVLNENYRDYLNRMRFFAADLGRNFILNFRYKF